MIGVWQQFGFEVSGSYQLVNSCWMIVTRPGYFGEGFYE